MWEYSKSPTHRKEKLEENLKYKGENNNINNNNNNNNNNNKNNIKM